MGNKKPKPQTDLRRKAEELLEHSEEPGAVVREDDVLSLLHELHVHQVELELQNDELRSANTRIEHLLRQYSDLYDFAPVGYVTISAEGTITDINLTAAKLLGLNRSELVGRPIWAHVPGEHRDRVRSFLLDAKAGSKRQTMEAVMLRRPRSRFQAVLDCVAVEDAFDAQSAYRITISDISALRKTEHKLEQARNHTHQLAEEKDTLAGEKAAADERADRETYISQMLQRALKPPRLEYRMGKCDIAVRYRARSTEAGIGGDFFDVFELPGGQIGIMVGDVTGKGVEAVAAAVAARHIIRSYAYLDTSPAVIMTLANRAVCLGEEGPESLITCFLATVDPQTNAITYTIAGHEPPVMRGRDGNVSELKAQDRALGIGPESIYSEHVIRLESGDLMVVLTDGVTESRRSGHTFGKDRAMRCIAANAGMSPAELTQCLLDTAANFAFSQLQDDVIILAIACAE